MRIRLPPQLIIFALGFAFAMAVPGLPRLHHGPPSIAAGLPISIDNGAPGWGERLDAHFPVGSSAETLVSELRRQGFELRQRDELSGGGQITFASYAWSYDGERKTFASYLLPYHEGCQWQLGIEARSDRADLVRDTVGELRLICGDTGGAWREAPGPLDVPPPPSPF